VNKKPRSETGQKLIVQPYFTSNEQGKGLQVDRQSNKEIAESLLMEWHRWADRYRPKLGAPRVSPYCQQSVTSKQYDDPADLAHDKVYQSQMQAVDFCVSAIAVPMQQAIGCEMKNRACGAKVWRCPGATNFGVALDAVMVVMRKRGLFD
jgi:hypothetical protein